MRNLIHRSGDLPDDVIANGVVYQFNQRVDPQLVHHGGASASTVLTLMLRIDATSLFVLKNDKIPTRTPTDSAVSIIARHDTHSLILSDPNRV